MPMSRPILQQDLISLQMQKLKRVQKRRPRQKLTAIQNQMFINFLVNIRIKHPIPLSNGMFDKYRLVKKIIGLAIINICFACYLQAQTDTTENSKPQFKLSVNYNSNLHYYGRTDSLRSSGFFPLAELWFKNFYVNAAPVFVNNVSTSFDYAGTVATAGYLLISDNKKWFNNFFVLIPFYAENSQLVQSSLKLKGV